MSPILIQCTDLPTWLLDNRDRIYRFLVYGKGDIKDYNQIVEPVYEEGNYYRYGQITEAIDLNYDHLIGIRELLPLEDVDSEPYSVAFYPLSRLKLEYVESDKESFVKTEGDK